MSFCIKEFNALVKIGMSNSITEKWVFRVTVITFCKTTTLPTSMHLLHGVAVLEDVFCNHGVKYLVTYLMFRSTCDIVGLDEALQPWVCIYFYSWRTNNIHDPFQISLQVIISEYF